MSGNSRYDRDNIKSRIDNDEYCTVENLLESEKIRDVRRRIVALTRVEKQLGLMSDDAGADRWHMNQWCLSAPRTPDKTHQ